MFKRLLINFALRLLKSQLLDKIEYAPLSGFLNPSYTRIEKVADLVTDANPNDKQQLIELWETEKHAFISDTLGTAIEIVSAEVKNPEVSAIIIDLLRSVKEEQDKLAEAA